MPERRDPEAASTSVTRREPSNWRTLTGCPCGGTNARLLYRSDLFRLRCLLSVVAVASFAIKVYLYNTRAQFADWWNGTPLKQILAIYVQPEVLPRWQWAIVLNSLGNRTALEWSKQWLIT